jgi:hypothetical protein
MSSASRNRVVLIRYLSISVMLFSTPLFATSFCHTPTSPETIVELFTSEGCSSCPPADRWLSQWKNRSDILAMSFHVDYWNNLGWKDPFATSVTTQRQYLWKSLLGASYVYTPQVIVGGQDFDWRSSKMPLVKTDSKDLDISLNISNQLITADISPITHGSNQEMAAHWVGLQDNVTSYVKAGENSGSTLKHDHVVIFYQPVPKWNGNSIHHLELSVPEAAQRMALVVTDPKGLKPIMAKSVSLCR